MKNFIKERDLGEVMGDTINFFIKEFMPLAKILLLFIGPFILINAYILYKFQAAIEFWTETFMNTQKFDNFPQEFFYLLLISMIQNILLVTVVSAYIKLRTSNKNHTIGTSDIWKVVSVSILNVTFGQILVFLAVLVGSFLIALTGSIGLSILLILIWGTYVMVSMYLLTFVIVFEKKTLFDALSRTLYIVKKKRWHIFGAVIIFGLIVGLSNLLISFIIEKLISIISTGSAANFLTTILTELASLALSAVIAILPAYLYASFVAGKENPDLLEKISEINSDFDRDETESN